MVQWRGTFCNYRGYIQVNKSKLEKDVARLRSSIEREVFGRKSALPDQREISGFISENAYLLGGFVAGCLIGYGFA